MIMMIMIIMILHLHCACYMSCEYVHMRINITDIHSVSLQMARLAAAM